MRYLIGLIFLASCQSQVEMCNDPKRPWNHFDSCANIEGTIQYKQSHPSTYIPAKNSEWDTKRSKGPKYETPVFLIIKKGTDKGCIFRSESTMLDDNLNWVYFMNKPLKNCFGDVGPAFYEDEIKPIKIKDTGLMK